MVEHVKAGTVIKCHKDYHSWKLQRSIDGWGKKEDFTQLVKQAEEAEAMVAKCGNEPTSTDEQFDEEFDEQFNFFRFSLRQWNRETFSETRKNWKLRRLSWKIQGLTQNGQLNSWILLIFCQISWDFLWS